MGLVVWVVVVVVEGDGIGVSVVYVCPDATRQSMVNDLWVCGEWFSVVVKSSAPLTLFVVNRWNSLGKLRH